MKYAVDRIENDIVILQNLSDNTMLEVEKKYFNYEVNEKDVVIKRGYIYVLDLNSKEDRLSLIRQKMERLKEKKQIFKYF